MLSVPNSVWVDVCHFRLRNDSFGKMISYDSWNIGPVLRNDVSDRLKEEHLLTLFRTCSFTRPLATIPFRKNCPKPTHPEIFPSQVRVICGSGIGSRNILSLVGLFRSRSGLLLGWKLCLS
ncbi:hypothetical protein AVEN_247137-1 [Araneus ventricosus]|uniref:Uncharacterized protein n=1 Tax=Araneus ventricosus TaxID=182803 RepID=A0A4Y2UMU2_ARAVE|nr:hypothetical protein AVEN_247137-1 [Araneus ventricosus]